VSSNLELVKSIYRAWGKGDFGSADWADPEIEFTMIGGLNEGTWRGIEQMAEAWAVMLRAWDVLTAKAEDFQELDEERVLVFLRNEGRGKGSGIELRGISAKSANVFTIRDGRVIGLTLYWDRDRALSDLDLASQRKAQTD